MIPTELSTKNKSPRTDDNVQGNLLQNYEQKFANLPDHLHLIKLCSNVGITKTVARGQYFTTLDHAELDKLGGSCRECIVLRDNAASKTKGRIRWNTEIGPALEVAVSHHQGRYGIETMIESSFADGTCSWVVIVNGISEYVTEMTEETQDDHIDYIGECTGKFVAKSKTEANFNDDDSPPTTTLPYQLHVWTDVEPGPYDKSCFEVSKKRDDHIASTQSFSTPRRRRSSRIQNLGTDVSFRIYVFSVLVRSEHG